MFLPAIDSVIFQELLETGFLAAQLHDSLVDSPSRRSIEVLEMVVHHTMVGRPVGISGIQGTTFENPDLILVTLICQEGAPFDRCRIVREVNVGVPTVLLVHRLAVGDMVSRGLCLDVEILIIEEGERMATGLVTKNHSETLGIVALTGGERHT